MRDDRAVEWLEKDLELSEDSLTTKASGRNHETGEQLMQVPPKAGLHPSAFANEVFEVVDEQLELPRRSIKPSDGQVRFAKRRTSNSESVDRVGLAAFAITPALSGHQLGGHAHHSLAAFEEVRLQTPG